ncbi:integrase core domain-containing protein [Nocardia sp. NPDC004151]|uniref:integrase core domain-containing protein n=1 Tax=Nocardia sp. NPDC004151 TaxID=3364304 RepID=UPI00368D64EA
MFKTAFAGPDPLLRHVRTRVRSPQPNGVIERFFGTLKYEHLFRDVIADGDALDMEVHRFRVIYNTIRPSTTRYPAQPSRLPAAENRSICGVGFGVGPHRALDVVDDLVPPRRCPESPPYRYRLGISGRFIHCKAPGGNAMHRGLHR